jgi:cysteine desulfurase
MKIIYLDNAATTPVDPLVIAAMKPYFNKKYGNPSEFHALGTQAKIALEYSRKFIADFLGCQAQEIIFTGSATESINLSHKGLIEAIKNESPRSFKPHIITSAIEHSAVLETCRHLQKTNQAAITYLPVDCFGLISLKQLKKAIRQETVLVSVMYVNNEIGTIEPIEAIGRLIKQLNRSNRKNRIYFHTDATQAIQYLPSNVKKLGVDFLSFTGHKIYAPKGIGVLFAKTETPLARQLDGGGQEFGQRASTENLPYIVGLAKAVSLVKKSKARSAKTTAKLGRQLIKKITGLPGVFLTGHPVKRVPHIVSCLIDGVEGEAIVLHLSDFGIMVSSGSACTSSKLSPSHVLTAMGIPQESAHGSLRFSLGKHIAEKDIDYAAEKLKKIINQLRSMAPEFNAQDFPGQDHHHND